MRIPSFLVNTHVKIPIDDPHVQLFLVRHDDKQGLSVCLNTHVKLWVINAISSGTVRLTKSQGPNTYAGRYIFSKCAFTEAI